MSEADMIIKSLKNSGKKVEEFYTGNKGSDKNVGSIEEDIRILQEKDCMWHYPETRIEEAIEDIIADYTRQKQINEEHQKINGELREKVKELENNIEKISNSSSNNEELIEKLNRGETFTVNQLGFIKKNFIPKQKIKDKIEELNRKEQELQNSITKEEREEYEDANISYFLCDIETKREVLQELLQESEDK